MARSFLSELIIAEFDIDKGSCLRARYPPCTPQERDGYLAEQLLPDGAEKHEYCRSYMVCRHVSLSDRLLVPCRLLRVEAATAAADDPLPYTNEGSSSASMPDGAPRSDVSLPLGDVLSFSQGILCVRRSGDVLWRAPVSERSTVTLKTIALPVSDREQAEICITVSGGGAVPETLAACDPAAAMWGQAPDSSRGAASATTETTRCTVAVVAAQVGVLRERLANAGGGGGAVHGGQGDDEYGVTVTLTKKDNTVRRGGINKGIAAMGCDLGRLMALAPALRTIVDRCCAIKGSDPAAIEAQTAILRDFYDCVHLAGHHGSASGALGHAFDPAAFTVPFPEAPSGALCIPPASTSADALHLPLPTFGVAELIITFKENFATILTAVLCGRRIVVKGFQCPATVVSEAALAIGVIGCAITPDFIRARVFPYTSITNMETFLGTGEPYIVGTLNPMFESRPEWWDVLCDVDTGEVMVGASTQGLAATAAHVQGDKEFCRSLLQLLLCRGLYGGEPRAAVEAFARQTVAEYIRTLLCAAACAARSARLPPVIAALLEANQQRLLLAQLSGLFDAFVDQTLGGDEQTVPPLWAAVATLRRGHLVTDEDVLPLLQDVLRSLSTERRQAQLLAALPPETGGLLPIASALFRPDVAVRLVAGEVMRQLERLPRGAKAIGELPTFVLLAFEHLKAEMV